MQDTLQNRTIFCHDNLEVLRGIDSATIDLIYLDPPFNKKKVFTAPIGTTAEGASFHDIFEEEDLKDEWLLDIKEENYKIHNFLSSVKNIEGRTSYNFCYLAYMAVRLIECHRVLKEEGSIYLHCDPTMSHYLKLVMDCIFSEKNYRNEIIWRIGWVSGFKTQKRGWIRNHDTILYYIKSDAAIGLFNKEYLVYPDGYRRRDGKLPTGKGVPIEDTWNCSASDVMDSIMIKSFSTEKTGYPTQKPLDLLKRIINASSNKGDVVLDPFCGCATTLLAAENLGRQWIGADISIKAYELLKVRLGKEIEQSGTIFEDSLITFKTDPPERTDKGISGQEEKYVYIISNKSYPGEYKVGIATDPKNRLNSYQIGDPDRSYKLEYSFLTPHFREIEKHIHSIYENKHEWVKGDMKKIIADIEEYKTLV